MFPRLNTRLRAGNVTADLIAPGQVTNRLSISRNQPSGARSSAISAGVSALTLYAANTPRFNGNAQRLLIEGQAGNANKNPANEGAVAGTPGTPPTFWTIGNNGQGLNWNVANVGVETGIPYVDMRLSGTSSGTNLALISFSNYAGVAAPGQNWVSSLYFRRVAGSLTGLAAVELFHLEFDSGLLFLRQSVLPISSNPSSLLQGFRSLSVVAGASTAFVETRIYVFPNAGAAVDATFRIGAAQLEQSPFATSSVFPASGTTNASTRGADLISSSLANQGILPNGACTILWSGVIPAFVSGATHTIACVDDGSVNNRFTMRLDQATGQLQAQRSLAGVSTTANAGAVTANTTFKSGISINGSGRAAVSLNGSAPFAVTGGPVSGLTQIRIGNLSDGSASLWGEISRLRVLPYSVSDANLQVLVSALP